MTTYRFWIQTTSADYAVGDPVDFNDSGDHLNDAESFADTLYERVMSGDAQHVRASSLIEYRWRVMRFNPLHVVSVYAEEVTLEDAQKEADRLGQIVQSYALYLRKRGDA